MEPRYYFSEHFELNAKWIAVEKFLISINFDHLISNEKSELKPENDKSYKFYLFLHDNEPLLKDVISRRKWWDVITESDLISQADLIWDKEASSSVYKNLPVIVYSPITFNFIEHEIAGYGYKDNYLQPFGG